MDGQRVRRHLMRGFGHPIGGDKRRSECSRDGSGEFIVKRCAAAADETKLGRSRARVVVRGTVNENAVNRGYCGVPCHSESDNVTPKQVSREPARARKVSAAAAGQSSQQPAHEPVTVEQRHHEERRVLRRQLVPAGNAMD